MSAYTHQGHVYFIACGEYVKIGYTSQHVSLRLDSLIREQRGGRFRYAPADLSTTAPMHILHSIPGCIMRDERRLHGLFAAHHEVGEWFRLSPAFLLQMSRIQYVTDRELLANFRAARRELKRRAALVAAA